MSGKVTPIDPVCPPPPTFGPICPLPTFDTPLRIVPYINNTNTNKINITTATNNEDNDDDIYYDHDDNSENNNMKTMI